MFWDKWSEMDASQSKLKERCACGEGDDHDFTVVFHTMVYYRWVVSDRKVKNGMKSCSLL